MNKNELAAELAGSANMSKADASRFIGHVLGHIADAVKRGEEVRLDGFGTFTKQHRPAGEARNPRTGETVQVAAKDVPKFKPAPSFARLLND